MDGSDNYLPQPTARQAFPDDPFARFMPIYLAQLRRLLGRVLAEAPGQVVHDRSEEIFDAHNGCVRLNWGAVEVPQVESYFERYHSRATAAVRTAGAAILDGDQRALLRLYPCEPDFERDADRYSIGLTLTDRHRLIIYAKTNDRIRFEVRRHGRGRYGDLGVGNWPEHRLLAIFQVEREDAINLPAWTAIFAQFSEPDVPQLGDLMELVVNILRATEGNERMARSLLNRLIVDGGVSRDSDPEVTEEAITRLSRAGIIVPLRLRARRPVSHLERHVLTPDYASLRRCILAALSAVPDEP